jgi:transcriptional regulator with XRE-family HTH domain
MNTGRTRLRDYMERCRMKQKDLAALLGVTDAYLSQILSGRRSPGLSTALRIEDCTGVPARSWLSSRVSISGASTAHRAGEVAQ